jgi:esterase
MQRTMSSYFSSSRRLHVRQHCLAFLFLLSCAASFTSTTSIFHSRQREDACTRLEQSTTTLQETVVTLQWMEFHSPQPSEEEPETPVLLLHGLLGSKRNFATLAASLGAQLDRPRRIVGVDLRNHGDSDWSEEMSYAAMARDVVEFLDSQNIDRIILVGHSMGGKVAQALSLMHPERVEGLVVLDIAPVQYSRSDPHWKAVEDILHSIHAVDSVAASAGKAELDKHLRTSIPDPNLRAFVLTNYDNRKKAWKIPIGIIVDQLEAIAGFDFPEEACYEGDVFIIHGGQSRFVRHAYMDQIAGFFPNHMLTTIRGAGHWVHAEAPDDTIALLKRYLDR